MQALILVGGEGTRLRPLTCNMAKSMVPVLNTPFLEHVIRYLAGHGINDIILAQGHLSKPMTDYFQDGGRFGTKIKLVVETSPMGTAGAVKNAEQFLGETFLVLNGDIFTDLDITAMLQFHRERRSKVTIALTPVDDPTAYGLIETTSDGRVTRFMEKPSWEQITTHDVNAGTYILDKEVLKKMPPQTNYSFERQLFPQLLEEGEPIYGYRSVAYWIDIGTPEKYLQLHRDLMRGEVKGYTLVQGKVVKIGQGCSIHQQTLIVGPAVIGDGCSISRGVKLFGPVVIGPGNIIAEDALIDSSITWQNTRVGQRVNLNGCIVANDCCLDNGVSAERSVIGDHVTISRYTRLGRGSRVWPPV
ncbi:MAG: nucleotidyl transferase family protein [Chloroflexi bacterium]|nr:nucleotidyl transferase family protein [Chloroflexota bacterium]